MFRRKRLLIGLAVAGLFAACVVSSVMLTRRLTPDEDALVGTWATSVQTDGFTTTLLLRPDRTSRVCQVDGAAYENLVGDGDWRVEAGRLVVDMRHGYGPFRAFAVAWGVRLSGNVETFALEKNELLYGAGSANPVTLHRVADGP